MSKAIRIIAALVLCCVTGLGLLLVFGIVGQDEFMQKTGTILSAVGVLFLAAIGFSTLAGGKSNDEPEAPPRL